MQKLIKTARDFIALRDSIHISAGKKIGGKMPTDSLPDAEDLNLEKEYKE